MIELTKLNGSKLVINSDLIEFIEASPDSLITLTTGKKIMVQEKIPLIVAAVVHYRRLIQQKLDTPIETRQDLSPPEPGALPEFK
jgi:flagellar protein FlbD